jgi:hypothetical protein
MDLLSRDFTKTAVLGPIAVGAGGCSFLAPIAVGAGRGFFLAPIAVGAGRGFPLAAYDPLTILPPKTRRVMT